MTITSFVENLRDEATRVGYGRSFQRSILSVANKHAQIRRIDMIYLTRSRLARQDPARFANVTSRMAFDSELLEMRDQGEWGITDELIEGSHKGDHCLLSFVDGQLAGSTWIHSGASPEILPGLRISIPSAYLYNYAGFTHPDFRGLGLQAYRHHEILGRPEWQSKFGMVGYVESTNWSSKRGQSKSGYHKLGDLLLIGNGSHAAAFFSDDLKRRGIQRIRD
jgi:hypothetical protein